MPDPKQDLPVKDEPKSPASKPVQGATPKQPEKKQPPAQKKTPAQEKDDAFKYEMQYANGGFNNGVEVKPDKDGKLQLKISIYGGGDQKVMQISPLPESITKLIKAYEITATQNDNSTPEITKELQRYFDEIRNLLSSKIMEIITQADGDIKSAITSTFSEINKRY